jgi:hypothetical protein
MPGSKPHAEKDRFKDAYASSGFDLLTTLVGILDLQIQSLLFSVQGHV